MSEKRSASRQRVLKAGSIEFGGGAVDCTVRNFSDSGAALEVASPVGIPNEAVLFIPADHHRYPCIVVWRKETRIGVKFLKDLRPNDH
jgi:hypothetical protein